MPALFAAQPTASQKVADTHDTEPSQLSCGPGTDCQAQRCPFHFSAMAACPPPGLEETPTASQKSLAGHDTPVSTVERGEEVRAVPGPRLAVAVSDFEALPFDRNAAARYGTLVALTLAASRDPWPHRVDLMIAAIASARDLPLFTRNGDDFKGLESAVTVVSV
ncbi:MAG TPA: hypothetical protein VGS19_23415 [Streptosporangiaceae bacterium]|nr:hypothetical protein [Streptosporangiaceae bacterium]